MLSKSILDNLKGPSRIIFEPTINCNLRCPMCDRTHKTDYDKHKKEQLSSELTLKFLEDIASMGVTNILLIGGGEPLMHPDIYEYIKQIKKNNIHLHLWTNGTMINEKNAKFIAANCDMITFSMDSPHEEINDYLRGVPGTTSKVINSLNLLRQESKELYIRIHSVLSARNIMHLNDFLPIVDEFGINEVGGALVNPFPFVPADFLILEENREEYNLAIENFCEQLRKRNVALAGCYNPISKNMIEGIKKQFSTDEEPLTCNTCLGLWSQATVRPNGDVSVCCFSYKPILGNLHEKSFKEIWNSERAAKLRKIVSDGEYLDEPCKGCDLGHPVFTKLLERDGNLELFNRMINESR